MTTRISPSDDARRLDRALDRAIAQFRSDKTLGAGQRATAVHALEIMQFESRLGIALFPAEPVSQVIAALGRNYEYYTWLLSLWQPENHPHALSRIDALGHDRSLILDYLRENLPREVPGIYTEAKDPDHLERLMETPTTTAGRIDYAAHKERIDIVDYIGRTIQLRRMGPRFKGLCPFHQEKTPSFVVYPETRSWYCFGCLNGGDVIDFAKLISADLEAVA